jgi:tetratricopeptide (TPR) repeat protein
MSDRSRIAFAAILAVLLFAAPLPAQEEEPAATPAAAATPQFENLQVLPEDITRPELIGVMRGITRGLGVRCHHCHVGEEGMPLDEYDFASDGKELKKKARVMLEMVDEINTTFLPRVEEGAEVACVTCHHGKLHPETLEDALWTMYERAGTEGAIARYRQLRDEHYGGWAYDFGELTLLRFGERVAETGDAAGAKAVVELNLELFPESALSWFTLGELERAAGDNAAAKAAYETTIELEPRFMPAHQRLDALEEESGGIEEPDEGGDGG